MTASTSIAAAAPAPSPQRLALAAAVVGLLLFWAWSLYGADTESRALSFSVLFGTAFGIVLQRARFCFFCSFRDFYEDRDPRGVLSILVALAVGFVLYQIVITAWMPLPTEGRLPPTAHIGPASPVLALSSFAFGIGMAISGSCISAHLYRLGEGSPTAPFALIGSAVGFVAGFLTWNPLFLGVISDWPATWLPHHLGYGGTIVATLLALGALAFLAMRRARPQPADGAPASAAAGAMRRIFIDRWSWLAGGVAVGVIAMVAYFRVAPLGVTAELGSLSRTGASDLGLLPETLYGLDTLRGCATLVKTAILSNNGVFVMSLVAGSFAAAMVAGKFRPARPTGGQVARGLIGGVLMGWGAMVSLGCTVGVLLSGIHAGALSGWIFLVFCVIGAMAGIAAMRRIG